MEDTRHINLTDPATETVYCHYQKDVVKFDGVHVAKICWNCPYWGGLAEGYGVECVYDDPNATAPEVKYTKPNAAKAEAPEKPAEGEEDSVASAAGIAARDARAQLAPAKTEEEVPAEEEGAAAEGTAPALAEGEAAAAPAPGAAGAEEEMPTQPAAVPPAKAPAAPAPMPPVPPKKKKPFPPAAKSATATDILAAIAQEKHLPGKHDQRSHAGAGPFMGETPESEEANRKRIAAMPKRKPGENPWKGMRKESLQEALASRKRMIEHYETQLGGRSRLVGGDETKKKIKLEMDEVKRESKLIEDAISGA